MIAIRLNDFCIMVAFVAKERACGRARGLSDRPLETFGCTLSYLNFIES